MMRTVSDERPDMYGMDGDGVPMQKVEKAKSEKRWIDRVRAGEEPDRGNRATSSGKHPSR